MGQSGVQTYRDGNISEALFTPLSSFVVWRGECCTSLQKYREKVSCQKCINHCSTYQPFHTKTETAYSFAINLL